MLSRKKILFNVLSVILVVAIFFFLGREILNNWGKIKEFQFKFNLPVLLSASALYALAFIPLSAGWHLILKYVKTPLPFLETFLYFCITQPAKYIPGKIWIAVTRMKFCKTHNVPHSITLLSTGIESIVEIIASSYIALIAFFWTGALGKLSYWGIMLATISGLIILYPPIFYACINLYLKIVKREPLPKNQQVSFLKLLLLQMIFMLGMFMFSFSQVIFLQAFAPITPDQIPFLTGIAAFSYVASILAVFTPSGLGVRESIWYLALKYSMASHVALMFAFISRIWTIIIEAILLFISVPVLWMKHRMHNKLKNDQ